MEIKNNKQNKTNHSWDMGLSADQVREILSREISWRTNNLEDIRNKRACGYLAVLLIQLTNGCRVGEAVEAYRVHKSTKQAEVKVRVEKRRDNQYRLIVVTPEAARLAALGVDVTTAQVKMYAQRLGINTHSLRYCFITQLAKAGVNPAVIAKLTGHKRLDTLLHYIQKREAENVLRDFANGKVC